MSFIGVRLIAVILSPGLAGGAGVRQHRHLTGVLDGRGDVALVLGAVAGDPPGPDLAAVGDELPQQARVLVVDVGDLFLAEQADFLSWLANRRFRHRGAPWESPAYAGMVCGRVLERWFVGRALAEAARVRGPRVLLRARGAGAGGPAGSAAATAEPAAAGPVGLSDLGRGVPHGGADIVDFDLVDGPLLAVPGLVRPLAQPAVDDHPHATLQALGHVLGRLAPDVAGEEKTVAVLPLTAGVVTEPGGGGDAELGDRLAGGGVAQFWIVEQVAGDRDLGVACCHRNTPGPSEGVWAHGVRLNGVPGAGPWSAGPPRSGRAGGRVPGRC